MQACLIRSRMHVDTIGSGTHVSKLREGWAKLAAWRMRAMHCTVVVVACSGFQNSVRADRKRQRSAEAPSGPHPAFPGGGFAQKTHH